jgi:hypothetical protein
MSAIAGIFLILHGLVHLWYLTLSQGWVEFQPDMGWTGHSWLLSNFLADRVARSLASVLYVLAAVALVVSGVGVLAHAEWVKPLLVISAIFSAVVILVFWDGNTDMIVQKGLLGFIINLVILGAAILI